MVRFEIEINIAGLPVKFQVEVLDPWPDEDGFVRYAVSGERSRSVIAINKIYWEKPFIMTEEDAWDYLEKILYPEPGQVYTDEFVFTPDELELIRQQIGRYIMGIKS